MVEARLLDPHHEVDVGSWSVGEPREDHEVAAVPAVEHGGVGVVAHHRDGTRPWLHAADGGQQQRSQLGVAQRVGAHRESRVVVEQAEGGLLPRAEEVLLVGHPAQADDEVGEAAVDVRHDVEEARASGPQDLGAHDDRCRLRRDLSELQPRLGERAQRLVALFRHSCTGLSSGTRSNHRKP